MIIRQATSIDVPIGPFLDETDGKTAETALTITQADIRLKKNGGAWAQKAAAQTLTHEENGYYELTLDATDTDTVGQLIVAIHESGALPVWREFQVVEEAVYDALYAAAAAGPLLANSNGSGLSAIPWNAAWDAEVESEATDALNAYDPPTRAELTSDINSIPAAVWDRLTSALTTVGSIGKLLVDNVNATVSSRSSHSAADVWAVATRVLTAGTNIVLAKGTGVTGFNDLDAAGVRSAVGLASANLDTQLAAIDDYLDTELAAVLAAVDTEVAAIKAKTDNLPASPAAAGDQMALTSAAVDAILDEAYEGAETVRQGLRLMRSALVGKLAGAATATVTIRDAADSKNRITATVDADGNRTAVVTDAT